jgi:GTP-binding protein YchF
MQLGIIGLPQAGKSTIFKALTGGRPDQAIASVKVPDPRLDELARMFKPKKYTPAEVNFVELADSGRGFGKGEGWTSATLQQMGKMDALVHVVRAFDDPTVPHVEGSVDPARDIATMNLELAFADMALIEKRIERIGQSMKSAKASDREAGEREQELMRQLMAGLENEVPLRAQDLDDETRAAIEHYQFLTLKPMLLIVNIGDNDIERADALEGQYSSEFGGPGVSVAALSGKIESELAQMSPEEAAEFRGELGLAEPGLFRAIRLAYTLLGLISFLTAGEDEVRAWTVRKGSSAQKAAGRIHSDIERGFIRAEVVAFQDLAAAGSMAEAKKKGVFRLEGKTYIVNDGDVINFLFNV